MTHEAALATLQDRFHIVSFYMMDDGRIIETTEGGSARRQWAMETARKFAKHPLNVEGLHALVVYDRMARMGDVCEWRLDLETFKWEAALRRERRA